MKKNFDEPTKKQPVKEKTSSDGMTESMREVYDDLYGDPEYIENEWKYCLLQYQRAKREAFNPKANFESRMVIRKIATYWDSRKKALEKVLDKKSLERLISPLDTSK